MIFIIILNMHTTNETKNKWKCLLCNKKFSGDIPYNYHINYLVCQKQKKVYKCLICNKIFDQKSHFDEHSNSKKCNKDLINDKIKNIIDNAKITKNKEIILFKNFIFNNFDDDILLLRNDIKNNITKIKEYENEILKLKMETEMKENKIIEYKKKSIPKTLKSKVWDLKIGSQIGETKCLCCDHQIIKQSNFECGHIIAERNGGETILNNLIPICSQCNKSMGIQNFQIFKNKFF